MQEMLIKDIYIAPSPFVKSGKGKNEINLKNEKELNDMS
jgi:hypothetical protein